MYFYTKLIISWPDPGIKITKKLVVVIKLVKNDFKIG